MAITILLYVTHKYTTAYNFLASCIRIPSKAAYLNKYRGIFCKLLPHQFHQSSAVKDECRLICSITLCMCVCISKLLLCNLSSS